mmetsp:Transcript_136302/g.345164  ORF Transcript_136302/g.345164 Transcript_136302/m.345164 type:complete len:303 (+) Transcript_136302:405-1313(+)
MSGHASGLQEVNQVARGKDHRVVAAIDPAQACQRLEQRLVSLDPAHFDTRADELGEGADRKNLRVCRIVVVEHGLHVDGLEIEQLVGLVGTDDEVVFPGQGDKALPLCVGHRVASWVVVHGHRVHHLDLPCMLLQKLLNSIDVHAVLLHWHAQQAHAPVLDHGEGKVIRGLLHNGDVTGLAMHTTRHVRPHGGACGGHQVLCLHRQVVLLLEKASQRLAEVRVAQHIGPIRLVAIVQVLVGLLKALLEAVQQGCFELLGLQQLRVRPSLDEVLRLGSRSHACANCKQHCLPATNPLSLSLAS